MDTLDPRQAWRKRDSAHDYLHEVGADWTFTIKGNQPTLRARLKALNWAEVPVGDLSRDVGHGHRETRTVYVMSIENIPDRARYGLMEFFGHAAQAIKLIRRVHRDGAWHVETVYAITSLNCTDAHPSLLAAWIRGHWRIENSLHWVRDVTFAEDAAKSASDPVRRCFQRWQSSRPAR